MEAEQHVIGSLLICPDSLDAICDLLMPEDFTGNTHKHAYRMIIDMINNGMPVDIFTLSNSLKGTDADLAYLAELYRNTPSAANIKAYAKVVKDHAINRKLFSVTDTIAETTNSDIPMAEKLDRIQAEVMAISDTAVIRGPSSISSIVTKAMSSLDERFNNGGITSGLCSGFSELDSKLSGLQDGDLIILAGRPSMGKTTLATNIATHVSQKYGSVLIQSMEMSEEQIINRELSAISGVDFSRIRNGNLEEEDWPKITLASSQLSASTLYIDDQGNLTINQIRSRARRFKRQHGLDLLIIDYLQLMHGHGNNQNMIIGDISRRLKALAKELSIPIICLSQLSRKCEERSNKRPLCSDLRDSGSIEQDADVVIFVYRDEVYDEYSPDKGTAEIIIAKHRNGPTGTLRLAFDGKHVRFKTLDKSWSRKESSKPPYKHARGFKSEPALHALEE